jgi:hemerythrin
MALITWSDAYSIKVAAMDEQHKKLLNIMNELHEYQKQGKSKEIIEKTLKGLVDYTRTHFGAEERFLQQNKYPKLAEHQAIHKNLLGQVEKYMERYKAGEGVIAAELNNFLKDWLIKHILNIDMEYGKFINQNAKSKATVGA